MFWLSTIDSLYRPDVYKIQVLSVSHTSYCRLGSINSLRIILIWFSTVNCIERLLFAVLWWSMIYVNRTVGRCYNCILMIIRADSRFAPTQWETAWLYNEDSHWLGESLESVLIIVLMSRCVIIWNGTIISKLRGHCTQYHLNAVQILTIEFHRLLHRPNGISWLWVCKGECT